MSIGLVCFYICPLDYIANTKKAKIEIKCTEKMLVDDKLFATMCRCGASNNKPYCDGTHTNVGFKAEAREIKLSE